MNNRTQDFLSCLGNGKSMPEIEAENDEIDEYLFKKPKGKLKDDEE